MPRRRSAPEPANDDDAGGGRRRALWKGVLGFGLVSIPVSLYPASRAQAIDLDYLDRRDFAPVGYKRVNKVSGREVEWKDIVKGYKLDDGDYVVLGDEDFRLANPLVDADRVDRTVRRRGVRPADLLRHAVLARAGPARREGLRAAARDAARASDASDSRGS